MNINNLTFLNTLGDKGAPEASIANVQDATQGMNEEFLALLGQEINPENPEADIMAILKTMSVDDVNTLVKTLSEEVNAQNTTQEEIVSDLLSQFKTKESLVKAMDENPKLTQIIQNLNDKIIEKNPILAQVVKTDAKASINKNEDEVSQKEKNQLALIKNNTDDFVQMKTQSSKLPSQVSVKNINAFKDQLPVQSESMIKANLDAVEKDILSPESVTLKDSSGESQTVLSMKVDTTNLKASESTSSKVLDVNTMQDVENTDQMITKIQDYLIQSKVSNEKSVEMNFMHKDLGQINLHVEKMNNNQIQVSIMSSSAEGAKFFKDNHAMLTASLAASGLDVSQIKLDSSSSSSFEFDQRESQSGDFAKENEQRQNQRDHKRRNELWQLLNEGQVA